MAASSARLFGGTEGTAGGGERAVRAGGPGVDVSQQVEVDYGGGSGGLVFGASARRPDGLGLARADSAAEANGVAGLITSRHWSEGLFRERRQATWNEQGLIFCSKLPASDPRTRTGRGRVSGWKCTCSPRCVSTDAGVCGARVFPALRSLQRSLPVDREVRGLASPRTRDGPPFMTPRRGPEGSDVVDLRRRQRARRLVACPMGVFLLPHFERARM